MTDWRHIVVSLATLNALRAVRESMEKGAELGTRNLETDPRGRVSLDQVIRLMIADRTRHRDRSRRSAKKRRSVHAIQQGSQPDSLCVPAMQSASGSEMHELEREELRTTPGARETETTAEDGSR